jgi:hypothetical protein
MMMMVIPVTRWVLMQACERTWSGEPSRGSAVRVRPCSPVVAARGARIGAGRGEMGTGLEEGRRPRLLLDAGTVCTNSIT